MAAIESHALVVRGEQTIHCVGCQTRIETVLARMPGVTDAEASHRDQTVRISLNSEIVTVQQVREKLEQLGYETASAETVGSQTGGASR